MGYQQDLHGCHAQPSAGPKSLLLIEGEEDSVACPGLLLLGIYLLGKATSSPVTERVILGPLSHAFILKWVNEMSQLPPVWEAGCSPSPRPCQAARVLIGKRGRDASHSLLNFQENFDVDRE